jgi:hypothetical protein
VQQYGSLDKNNLTQKDSITGKLHIFTAFF